MRKILTVIAFLSSSFAQSSDFDPAFNAQGLAEKIDFLNNLLVNASPVERESGWLHSTLKDGFCDIAREYVIFYGYNLDTVPMHYLPAQVLGVHDHYEFVAQDVTKKHKKKRRQHLDLGIFNQSIINQQRSHGLMNGVVQDVIFTPVRKQPNNYFVSLVLAANEDQKTIYSGMIDLKKLGVIDEKTHDISLDLVGSEGRRLSFMLAQDVHDRVFSIGDIEQAFKGLFGYKTDRKIMLKSILQNNDLLIKSIKVDPRVQGGVYRFHYTKNSRTMEPSIEDSEDLYPIYETRVASLESYYTNWRREVDLNETEGGSVISMEPGVKINFSLNYDTDDEVEPFLFRVENVDDKNDWAFWSQVDWGAIGFDKNAAGAGQIRQIFTVLNSDSHQKAYTFVKPLISEMLQMRNVVFPVNSPRSDNTFEFQSEEREQSSTEINILAKTQFLPTIQIRSHRIIEKEPE